jgi:hypothetical protein
MYNSLKSVLHSDNVFHFDDISISEYDAIIGMLTRMSRWFKFKLDQSIPRKVFSKVDDGTALMSTADYFVHQLDAAFKVADTDDKQQSTNATSNFDINDFMDNLTDDINNANSSKVLAAWDATGRAVRNAAAATRRAPAAAWTATKSAASSVAGAVSGLASRANATRKRVSERIDDSITASLESLVARRKAEQYQTQKGGAPSQGFGGMMAKLKRYVDDDDSAKKIIKPAMLADEYFERLSKIVPDVRRSGSSSSRPSIFGHPLLLYLPFARAFNCVIYVYTSESEPDTTTTNYILKYIFRGAKSEADEAEEGEEEESAHAKQVHEIHILDKNPPDTDYAFLDDVESYSSRFALLVLSNNNDDD